MQDSPWQGLCPTHLRVPNAGIGIELLLTKHLSDEEEFGVDDRAAWTPDEVIGHDSVGSWKECETLIGSGGQCALDSGKDGERGQGPVVVMRAKTHQRQSSGRGCERGEADAEVTEVLSTGSRWPQADSQYTDHWGC